MFSIWNFVAAAGAGLLCIVGDRLLTDNHAAWTRAFIDSTTHGAVALLSWMAVLGRSCSADGVRQSFLCALVAMLVDADHFLAAGSLRLKDALSLSSRPPFHNSSLILILFVSLYTVPYIIGYAGDPDSLVSHLPWIVLVALLSHHVRDATRRGLWFWPFGSTRPLPNWLYITIVIALPLLVKLILSFGLKDSTVSIPEKHLPKSVMDV